MLWQERSVNKQFATDHPLGVKNLIVSGCSFTFNNHLTEPVAWPYYLRDICGFEQVYDTSMPGAGNYHIASSLQWALELDPVDPADSLVIVMWSGNDRDDYVAPDSNGKGATDFEFRYTANCFSGQTGGSDESSRGNVREGLKNLAITKTYESRAVENFLYAVSLESYLKQKGYKFIFVEYMDRSLPARSLDFDIRTWLPPTQQQRYTAMFTPMTDPYAWALRTDQLWDDDYHPSPNGHLSWTREILIPRIKKLYALD
jgi:hypothetical protein